MQNSIEILLDPNRKVKTQSETCDSLENY